MQTWMQIYDPLGNLWLSSLIAALPIFFFFIAARPYWCCKTANCAWNAMGWTLIATGAGRAFRSPNR